MDVFLWLGDESLYWDIITGEDCIIIFSRINQAIPEYALTVDHVHQVLSYLIFAMKIGLLDR